MQALIRGHGPTPHYHCGAAYRPNGNYWWVAPNYPEISNSKIWDYLKKACAAMGQKNEIERTIRLTNGASISVRSADKPDTLRGPGLDGLVMDEAAMVHEEAWKEVLRPALADRQGWAMFCSTPKGRNWFYELFNRSGHDGMWASWQLPTADNPMVPPEELEQIKYEIGPRRFGQEHEAQFLEIEGALFPSAYFDERIWAGGWPDRFEVGVIAIDPSMGKDQQRGDYSAIVFAGVAGGQIYVDCDMERRPPIQIVEDTVRMWRKYRPDIVACEAVAFQEVMLTVFDLYAQTQGMLMFDVYPHKIGKIKKERRIQRLDAPLYRSQFRLKDTPGCRMLVEQLQMYPTKGVHDDGPDALEQAVNVLNQWAVMQFEGHEAEGVIV